MKAFRKQKQTISPKVSMTRRLLSYICSMENYIHKQQKTENFIPNKNGSFVFQNHRKIKAPKHDFCTTDTVKTVK